MAKELYDLFSIQKINVQEGVLVRAGSKLDSQKIIILPYNSLVALPQPITIKTIDKKERTQIIHPIKGWLYSEDLISLSTLDYVRHGSKYCDFIVDKMIEHGLERILEDTELINDSNIEVFVIPNAMQNNKKSKKNNDVEYNGVQLRKFSDIYKKEGNKEDLNLVSSLNKTKFHKEIPELKIPVIILTGSSWCDPCQDMKNMQIEIVNTLKEMKLYILDNDLEPELVKELNLDSLSNILFYSNGTKVGHLTKMDYTKSKLEKILTKFKSDYKKKIDIEILDQ